MESLNMDRARHDVPHTGLRTLAWLLVVAGASVALSRAFACAMPFAAIAAVAGSHLGRREAVAAVMIAWFGNQAVGFLLLGYPHTWTTFGWGGAIGLAALAAALVAAASLRVGSVRRAVLAFIAAFAAYECVLFAATFFLSSGGNAFAPPIVARILSINAVVFAALLIAHRLAIGAGFFPANSKTRPALA